MPESGSETRTFTVSALSSVAGSLLLSGATALWQHLHGHSIDWYGILGLFVLAALAFLLLLWVVWRSNQAAPQQISPDHSLERSENEKLAEEVQRLNLKLDYWQKPWRQYASEEAWKKATAEQNRLIELGRSTDGLLTPLQIDTLRLAKKVLQFMSDVGKKPEVDASQFLRDASGNPKDNSTVLREHLEATNRVLLPWIAQTRSTFKTDLLPELEAISLRYGKLGIDVDLVPHREEYLLTNRWLFDVSLDLVKLAHGIDTMKVVPMLDKA
jgi:hypothetical protein